MLEEIKKIVEQLEESKSCELCWRFHGAGRRDYANVVETNDCCVHVIYGEWSWSERENENNGEVAKTYTVNLFVGMNSSISQLFYNEKGVIDCDSKYVKIFKPLENCLRTAFRKTICFENDFYKMSEIIANSKINHLDNNLDGFELRVILKT